ncbi:antitoxin [candidate division KSB1 bacterium]|nr:antitoxin [candidate division KSB1 bacterium]
MMPNTIAPDEQDILDSVEKGEWQSVSNVAEEIKRYQAYAAAAMASNRIISLKLPPEDFAEIQQRASAQGVSSEHFIADILRQFVAGRLSVQP